MTDASTSKGILVSVYRKASGYDCTNRGVSLRHQGFTLVGPGVPEIFEPNDEYPPIRLIMRDVGFSKFYIAAPMDARHEGRGGGFPYMFGGNFIFSSEGRFPADHPIKVFDRLES